jgi:small-conductance mechanosensitive channel
MAGVGKTNVDSQVINLRGFAANMFDGWTLFDSVRGILTYPLVTSSSMKVSPLRLVIGIALLILVVVLSARISAVIENRIAKRRHIDPGLRYTIARLLRYLLLVVGILAALKGTFELDLTSIAVVFTALSVGIGFGLQYIAADIASGFILLFERPIRVGDRITIGDDEGDVQSIKMRTTIVLTNDRIAIIVPNSKLVSQRVINWSYGDPRARIAIPISVATTSDVAVVTETLLKAAEDVDNVLTDPPCKVQFLRFGDYSLDFRLLVWTRAPSRHPQIKSDINYRIERLFRERGIEIPFPTQQFLLKTGDADKLRDELGHSDKLDELDSPKKRSPPKDPSPGE